jgi:hypothetical protein
MKTKDYWIIVWISVFILLLSIFSGGFSGAYEYYEWFVISFFITIVSTLSTIWAIGRATGVTLPRNHPLGKIYKQLGW